MSTNSDTVQHTPQEQRLAEKNLTMINDDEGKFGLADLMKAPAEMLGNGPLGSSYKAMMSNGSTVVVKRIKKMNKIGKDGFDAEVRRLRRLKHKNILTLLAYHYLKEEKLFVYGYIPKGSLLYPLHVIENWPMLSPPGQCV